MNSWTVKRLENSKVDMEFVSKTGSDLMPDGRKGTCISLSQVKETLLAELIVGQENLDLTLAAGVASDLMSDLLTGPTSGAILLTGLVNIQVIRTALVAGIRAIVFVRGKRPNKEMVAHAQEHGLPLLSTPFTMFSACGRLFAKGLRGVERKDMKSPTRQ